MPYKLNTSRSRVPQGLLTTGYIILLSRVGESVASEMRKSLFASLLRFGFLSVINYAVRFNC